MRNITFIGCLGMALAALTAACGSISSGSTEGSGAAGTGAGKTTSGGAGGSVAPPPDGAWAVNMANEGTPTCMIATNTRMVGDVTDTDIVSRVTDDTMGATVACTVSGSGTGPFSVDASLSQGADMLQIVIPSISASATKAAPAVGSVAYESDATVAEYSSAACDFYFVSGTSESVGPGKIWVAFTCAGITNAASESTCALLESYALFESCETVGE